MSSSAAQTVVFANRYFYPDESATSQILSDLTFDLAKKGYRVRVVCGRQRYSGEGGSLPRHEVVSGVEIFRVWTTSFGRRGGLAGRALDYATFLLSSAFMLLRLLRPGHVVVAKTDPPMLAVFVAPISWLRRAPLVNWWQDVFPEVAQQAIGRTGKLGSSFAALRWLRNRALKAASMNIVIGERMAGHMKAQGVSSTRIKLVRNWSDGRLVTPCDVDSSSLRKQWGLKDKFVVAYSGNLGRAHDSSTFLSAIEALEASEAERSRRNCPPIMWLFIGGGVELEKLRCEVERRGLKSVMFQPYQPREQLSDSLAVANVHLVSLRPEFEGLIVPSKFYGIAAAGRPTIFIGDCEGEIADTLSQHGCGRPVRLGDGKGLARAVTEMACDEEGTLAMGAAARPVFEHMFDKPLGLELWHEALENVVAQNAAQSARAAHRPVAASEEHRPVA